MAGSDESSRLAAQCRSSDRLQKSNRLSEQPRNFAFREKVQRLRSRQRTSAETEGRRESVLKERALGLGRHCKGAEDR
jgi:hypothetical protein